MQYFEAAREEELLRLRWENEAMKAERERLNNKTKAAAA